MSGIAGIFFRDNRSVDPYLIENMNKSIAHRGPDGSGLWSKGPVALAHQMLHTTFESLNENLPLKDGELVITADARIDNRKELLESLGISETYKVITDSELILKSYQKWGEKCPEKLLGDFAFVIWDGVENKLFCARDHMGVKPFYYYLSDKLFVFASEIKAIFKVQEVPFEINEELISNFLTRVYDDKKITSYKEIHRLPAACKMILSFQGNQIQRYWELNHDYEVKFDTDEEYAEAFLDIFTEAIRCRLRSAFPVGSMLSGGLDSSSIACTAQKLLNESVKKELKTYSGIFESVPESNEYYFIQKVLDSNNFDPKLIEADKISPLEDVDEYLWLRDQPLIYPNNFLSWNIFREAGKDGVRTILSGADGDAVVSFGNGFLSELFRTFRWRKLIFEIEGLSKKLNVNPIIILLALIKDILIPNIFKRNYCFLNENFKLKGSNNRIINIEFSKKMNVIKKSCKRLKLLEKINKTAKTYHHWILNSQNSQITLEYIDCQSSPFSVEVRHPFYDKRLVEFCLAIPTEQKIWKGWDRVIMRRAMKDILPIEVQWRRKKSNLAPNFFKNLLKYEQELLDDLIYENYTLIEEYVDVDKIQNIYTKYKSDINSKDNIHIWEALILTLWFRKIVN